MVFVSPTDIRQLFTPRAAYSHCISLGSVPPRASQKACAFSHVTLVRGWPASDELEEPDAGPYSVLVTSYLSNQNGSADTLLV
jgi:hypothetical protein